MSRFFKFSMAILCFIVAMIFYFELCTVKNENMLFGTIFLLMTDLFLAVNEDE